MCRPQQFNRSPFQEINKHFQADFPNIIRPVVKRSFQPTRVDMLPLALRQAMTTMLSGRPGPVNLDVPFNVFQEEDDVEVPPAAPPLNSQRSGASPDEISACVDLILKAKRPVIFIGHGVTLSEASKELTEFAHRLQIPVISSPNGMGCLDMNDPLSLGFIGRNGAYPANEAGRHADLVIAIGARFDDRSASSWMPGYSWNFPASKLIHVDVDPAELGRNYPPDIGILADARTFLRQLLDRGRTARRQSAMRLKPWLADIKNWQGGVGEIHPAEFRDSRFADAARAHRRRLRTPCMPPDAILCCDVGVNHNWYMQFWKPRIPQNMLNSWGFSGMGFGAAGALGAKLAAPDRPVVAVTGDGCFTMVPHVLCTAVEYNIPVVWVIWNNFGWVSIRDIQLGMFGGREHGTMFHEGANQTPYNPDFAADGASCGVEAIDRHQVAGLQGRARARDQGQQALRARRACRRRGAAALDRRLAVAADALQGAGVRQALSARLRRRQSRKSPNPMAAKRKAFIRNIAEVPWLEFPNHFGGALSKPLVMPDTAGSQHIDYRISMYQPKAYVETHSHKVQEQVYHVIEGEGLMHIDGKDHVVRKHDFIFLPPGVEHAISNTGLVDLVFLVVTSPVTDDEKPV